MGNNSSDIVEQLRRDEQIGLLQNNNVSDKKNFDKNKDISQLYQSCILQSLIKSADESNTSILICDHKGNINYINNVFTKITGYDLLDLKGSNVKILFDEYENNPFFKKILSKINQGIIWTGELKSIKKNNQLFWQHTTIIPIEENNKIAYYLSINKDITPQKKIHDTLNIKENAILSSINAIVLTDLSGKITYVNPSFLKMWSIDSEKKIVNAPVFSLWKKCGEYVNIMDKIISRGGWLGELIAQDYQGKLFPVQMSASVVRDDENKPVCIMASFVDISKQKRLEKNYKKFKKISDEADYGTIIFDLEGNILYVNNAFAKMYDYSIKDITGEHISILYNDEQKYLVNQMLEKLRDQGKIIANEQDHIKKNGVSFPVLITGTRIDDEQFHQPFIAGTISDISTIKEAEKKIIKNAEELKNMNNELNNAKEKLSILNLNLEKKVLERTSEIKKLLKQKDVFINQLGHDLRTPLTPIFALLPLLEKEVCSEKGKEFIHLINKNSRFMRDLVNKTISYTMLNSDKLELTFQDIELHAFADRIIAQMKLDYEGEHIEFVNNIDDELKVSADEYQIKELFQHLISNAIKYKKSDNNAVINLNASFEEDSVIVSVEDNGIGMSEDQISNIFNVFYKADLARSDVNSHGLGLNICKKIIEKHKGSIWAESDGIGKGTRFYFTVPRIK